MLPKRLRISKTATDVLKMMKARTGLTPNIVCRMAILISLEEGEKGGLRRNELVGSEFNAATLFGEFSQLFELLLHEVYGELDSKTSAILVASHIDDGLDRIRRAKNLVELLGQNGLLLNDV